MKMGNSSKTQFYAHTKEGADESEWQLLNEHLIRVADYAAAFGRDAGVSELAKMAGRVHDLGKYSIEFQARLRGSKVKVDHATAGAKELTRIFKGTPQEALATLLAYCVSGHHTGLLNYGDSSDLPGDGTLTARLKTDVCDYSAYKTELNVQALAFPHRLPIRPLKGHLGFSLSLLTRMIYSTLVDADFQETEEFMQGKKPRGEHEDIPTLCSKLNTHLQKFKNPTNNINRKRTETLHACVAKSAEKPGFFQMTVPTGGGKTLASMAFALNHACTHGLKRIIYVIPFTTIIEQNAGVFKEILGEVNVLEHHSNFDWERKRESGEQADDRTHSVYAKLKLAAENWDIPIVVTTNVQFFESLFANKSSRCRKLHNIAKSVLIFDEAQMFPRDFMYPAMSAIWELVTNYGTSVVFCTATQPKLEQFLPEETQITELAPDPQSLFDFYKRVEVKYLAEKLPDNDLIARLNAHEQVLCIVNTRKHASGLFGMLTGEGNFHLSTLMCPAHRRERLAEIRDRLESGRMCRVISTSVMEAGIDVDFPIGYRAVAGLDSINQAAGRVNREMKHSMSEMFIFEPQSEFIKRTPRYISQAVEVARSVFRDHAATPISIAAIEAYFRQLYSLQDPQTFDFKRIMECFDDRDGKFNFGTAGREFHVIEDLTETVIIPFNKEARDLLEELKYTPYPFSTMRKLQPYTVSIYSGEFEAISSHGVILTIAENYAVLNPDRLKDYYSLDRGLLVPANSGGDALFC